MLQLVRYTKDRIHEQINLKINKYPENSKMYTLEQTKLSFQIKRDKRLNYNYATSGSLNQSPVGNKEHGSFWLRMCFAQKVQIKYLPVLQVNQQLCTFIKQNCPYNSLIERGQVCFGHTHVPSVGSASSILAPAEHILRCINGGEMQDQTMASFCSKP